MPPLPSNGLVLCPTSAAQTCGCNHEHFMGQRSSLPSTALSDLRPSFHFSLLPWDPSRAHIHGSHHVSMFLNLHGLNSYLPSLNSSYYFLITLFCKTLSTYSVHPDLVWEACSLLRTEPTVTSKVLTLNTWPLTPSGPLMQADHETAQICSSHSVTLPVGNSALFLPQISNTASPHLLLQPKI